MSKASDIQRESPAAGKDGKGRRFPFIFGIESPALFTLLYQNRFRVSFKHLWELITASNLSMYATAFHLYEDILYRRKVARTEILEPPIFILGHWRSGTSYLHKLLSLDERHTSPTLLQCTIPNCFLTCGNILRRKVAARSPARRPMDNVKLGPDEPFEDEFALMKTTLMSPLLNLLFPDSSKDYDAYCDFSSVPALDRRKWAKSLVRFLKKITLSTGKRIVAKSPVHTFRVGTLLSVFPDARFVYIMRDPYTVFASTCNLWKKLAYHNRFQDAEIKDLEELVFSRYVRMFRAWQRDRALIRKSHYCEIRFEDLDADPMETMRSIYERISLPGFQALQPRLRVYLDRDGSYQKNRYQLTAEEKEEIYRRWGPAFEAYGYEK